ncbi:MAG: DUF1330 domain-containing protein [Micropepsaceae bacterium]
MAEEHFVDPSRDNFNAFKALPRNTPIHMLNLVQYRERALYPGGHSHAQMNFTGAQAYAEYGRTSEAVFTRIGGQTIWRGRMEAMVTGPTSEVWDNAFIALYPSAAAFLEMVTDPAYRVAVVHRQAAVLTSRLVRMAPADAGKGFGS